MTPSEEDLESKSELDIEASYASGFRIGEVAKGFSKIDIKIKIPEKECSIE